MILFVPSVPVPIVKGEGETNMIVVFLLVLERSKHHQSRNVHKLMQEDLEKEPRETLCKISSEYEDYKKTRLVKVEHK